MGAYQNTQNPAETKRQVKAIEKTIIKCLHYSLFSMANIKVTCEKEFLKNNGRKSGHHYLTFPENTGQVVNVSKGKTGEHTE